MNLFNRVLQIISGTGTFSLEDGHRRGRYRQSSDNGGFEEKLNTRLTDFYLI